MRPVTTDPPTHPDLAALGRADLLERYDDEALPGLVTGAVHEAGHSVARMHQGVGGGDLLLRPDGTGLSHGSGATPPMRQLVAMVLAGGVAEGELAVRTSGGDEGARVDAYDLGGAYQDLADLRRLPAYAVDALDEAVAIGLLRANWPAVLRLAAALLNAPDGRLTWEQQTATAGPITEAADDVVADLHEQLETGRLESLVARVHARA